MAAAVARRAGALATVVITDPNPERRALAHVAANITLAVDTREISLKQVQEQLGMNEGFERLASKCPATPTPSAKCSPTSATESARSPCSASSSPAEMAIDWHYHVIFNQLTLRGVYGREMYETWYKMTVMLQSGLKIDQVITHRYNWKDFEQGFEAMRTGSSGKVILDWNRCGLTQHI